MLVTLPLRADKGLGRYPHGVKGQATMFGSLASHGFRQRRDGKARSITGYYKGRNLGLGCLCEDDEMRSNVRVGDQPLLSA